VWKYELFVFVEFGDLCGDLYMYMIWLDGKDLLEDMVVVVIECGYVYYVICDYV